MRRFASRILNLFTPSKPLAHHLEQLLGFRPVHIGYYQLALAHRSQGDTVRENNERLEYLGDAILGAIVAEYLFKKYPMEAEGFLTEMRSRMVRRESLNEVAKKMGLNKLMQFNHSDRSLNRSHIFGNALEALVGAIYLDQGYSKTRQFVIRTVIQAYMDMDLIEVTDTNFKNQLMSWAQRQGKKLTYETISEKMEGPRKVFTIAVLVDEAELIRGTGYTKKEASQDASKKALNLVQPELLEAEKGL